MRYISLINDYEGVKLSINLFPKPAWLTEAFNREMERFVNPTGDVSKMVAGMRILEMRGA